MAPSRRLSTTWITEPATVARVQASANAAPRQQSPAPRGSLTLRAASARVASRPICVGARRGRRRQRRAVSHDADAGFCVAAAAEPTHGRSADQCRTMVEWSHGRMG